MIISFPHHPPQRRATSMAFPTAQTPTSTSLLTLRDFGARLQAWGIRVPPLLPLLGLMVAPSQGLQVDCKIWDLKTYIRMLALSMALLLKRRKQFKAILPWISCVANNEPLKFSDSPYPPPNGDIYNPSIPSHNFTTSWAQRIDHTKNKFNTIGCISIL